MFRNRRTWFARTVLAVLFCAFAAGASTASPAQQKAALTQKTFATPQEAAEALIQAAGNYDLPALLEIFGPDGRDFVSSADPVRDKSYAAAFAAKAQEKHAVTLDPKNKNRAILSVGDDDWPLPVPVVKRQGKWLFDSKAGHDEILYRRTGANELDAIQICRGFVEAQEQYASQIHDNSGLHQYAQKVISSPGKQDGLYWQTPEGTPAGPISEPIAKAIAEGYTTKDAPYHGYYFKILKGQGPAAPLGRLDYVIQGAMIGGFALVAIPAQYRVTGVKTFMVSHDGIVYEKDLGPDSPKIAGQMELYNPDQSWRRTTDNWPADALSTTTAAKEEP